MATRGPTSVQRRFNASTEVDVNLNTDLNIETKVEQSYIQDVDRVRIHRNQLRERIATFKQKARHDVNVTDCTPAIGNVVYIRVRTWRGKIQEIWSPIVHEVICVPCVGSNVYGSLGHDGPSKGEWR